MKHLPDLFPVVQSRIVAPVLIAMGPPWPVTQMIAGLQGKDSTVSPFVPIEGATSIDDITCFQMDVFQSARLREKLAHEGLTAEVVTAPDLWDLPARFKTVLFPAAAFSDRELKLDMVEQGYHVLAEGGRFITLSEYEKDTQFAKWHKRIFGKYGESPTSDVGMAFWSTRTGDQPRRRHAMTFHARIGDDPSMSFESWPGTFSYGRMDGGARAMLEVAQSVGVKEGETVLDMGCGNGAVGCLASPWVGETGSVVFVDSNVRATTLTELNAKANGLKNYRIHLSASLEGLEPSTFDVCLANPPYYANSEVARMFIASARELLRPGGRFFLVTKMPVQTIPEVVETFGDVESIDNRGYTILIARV